MLQIFMRILLVVCMGALLCFVTLIRFWQGVACIVAGLAAFGCPLQDNILVRYCTGMASKGQEFYQSAEVTPVRFDYNEGQSIALSPLADFPTGYHYRRFSCQSAASYTICVG